MALFQILPLRKKSFLQRIFRQEPPENAIIEVNNLLAGLPPLKVKAGQLSAIEAKYDLKLADTFSMNLQEFYAVRWNDWLKTGESDAPIDAELGHLAGLFGLDPSVTGPVIQLIGEAWYRDKLQQILRNRKISDKDEGDLKLLKEHVRLRDQTAEQIFNTARLGIIEAAAAPFIRRERLGTEDQQVLDRLAADLRLPAAELLPLAKKLSPYKYYWQLENLPLQAIPVNGQLQKSESCYFQAKQVKWLETRSAGRGLRHLEAVNYGTVYLTNKRLVFEGNAKNSTLPYDRIRQISRTREGIELQKDKGKDPVLQLPDDAVAFQIVLQRLVHGNF